MWTGVHLCTSTKEDKRERECQRDSEWHLLHAKQVTIARLKLATAEAAVAKTKASGDELLFD